MKVIAYYTDDSIYSQHACLLQKSLDNFSIAHDIESIETTDWLTATAFKPAFILEKLESNREPLLYIDIDTVIHADIRDTLSAIDEDIAIHITPENELLSGVIYLQPTEHTFQLLRLWRQAMVAEPGAWDQRVLQKILAANPQITIHQLPAEFVFIFDTFKERYPEMQPVIEHLQASRETKYREKLHLPKYRLLRYLGIRPKVGRLLLNRRKRMRELLDQRTPG
jgi:hypothetical protein